MKKKKSYLPKLEKELKAENKAREDLYLILSYGDAITRNYIKTVLAAAASACREASGKKLDRIAAELGAFYNAGAALDDMDEITEYLEEELGMRKGGRK